MNLFGNTVSLLERGLHYSTTKSKVISQNIANIDTPTYKAKDVRFQDFLEEANVNSPKAYRTHSLHLEFNKTKTHPGVSIHSNFRYRHDGNGVDMDKEQASLATNQIYYHALVDRLNGKFNTLQNVIKGGR